MRISPWSHAPSKAKTGRRRKPANSLQTAAAGKSRAARAPAGAGLRTLGPRAKLLFNLHRLWNKRRMFPNPRADFGPAALARRAARLAPPA
jgi:hypothetical protein